MEKLFELHFKLLKNTDLNFVRSIEMDIKWKSRLIGIIGARGVGKTTLLLQHIKSNFINDNTALYISLDNIWFANNKLIDLADQFVKKGGTHLFLDEVHKYPNWSQELKNIYDNFPELKVVFTGSSLLEILNSRSDLSRRALVYDMQGLSFREFLNLETGNDLPVFTIDEILKKHPALSEQVIEKVKPLKYFQKYLSVGYYPFYKDFEEMYPQQLMSVVNMIIEIELPLLRKVDIAYSNKIKQLLSIIAQSVPFIPNISKLSEKIAINRQTLLAYLYYLQEAGLTKNLYRSNKGISLLQKPEKIFLENTNLSFAFLSEKPNVGSLRETFFYNQLGYKSEITFPDTADFLVNNKFLFEIGGAGKKEDEKNKSKNFYIAADDIEYGYKNKIPLWLFGFLY